MSTQEQRSSGKDNNEVSEEDHELFFRTKRKLNAVIIEAQNIRANLHPVMRQALARFEATMKKIKVVKRQYDDILEEMRTVHNRSELADILSRDRKSEWNFIDNCPEYWTGLDTGKLRLEVKPGPEHEWHDEWRGRLLRGEGCYGPQGPPPYPPFNLHPPWEGKTMTRKHPNAYYFEEDSPRKLWLEQREKLKKKKPQRGQEETSEAGPSQQRSTRTRGSRVPSTAPSQPTESSNSRTQSSKRDKAKGLGLDNPNPNPDPPTTTTTQSTTAPIAGPSSASAPAPILAPASPSASGSASTSTVAGPFIAHPNATTDNNTITSITATVSKEEGNQETVANNAEDKSTTNVQRRATKIKIIPPGSKKDVKGKGNNNAHKILKPSGSKQPAAVAAHRIIKRSQVVKGKYWAFKLDSSMFTQDGSIKAAFSDDKGNSKSKAKGKVNGTVSDSADDNGEGNGEGSSSMASSSKTATAINNGNDNNDDDNDSDDELALGQDIDDYDSGSETDNSKDSTFTLTSKSKKDKVATAAVAATTASSSDSSSNKRKRATTDTGDEEQNAYYVLRCPLDLVPDRKNTPVNDEGALKHNRTLIRSLVHKARGGKKEKEKIEKELEEDL